MNISRLAAALCLVIIAVAPAASRADDVRSARRAIQARYDQFNRAYMRKDFAAVADIFTPDCLVTLESEGRSMRAPRVLAGMRAVSVNLTVSRARTRIVSVKPVTGAYEVAAIWTGYSNYAPKKPAADDPARRSWTTQGYRDTWKQTAKGWQIARRLIQASDAAAHPR